jgi:hypothetical protein
VDGFLPIFGPEANKIDIISHITRATISCSDFVIPRNSCTGFPVIQIIVILRQSLTYRKIVFVVYGRRLRSWGQIYTALEYIFMENYIIPLLPSPLKNVTWTRTSLEVMLILKFSSTLKKNQTFRLLVMIPNRATIDFNLSFHLFPLLFNLKMIHLHYH